MRTWSLFGGIICFPALSAKPDLSTVAGQAPSAAVFLQRFGALYRTELLCRFDPAEGCKPPLIPHDRETKLPRLYAKDLARSFALPPGRSRGKQAAFAPVRTTLSLVYEAGLTLRPTDSKSVALQLSYSFFPERRAWSGVPCLVRHKMRHAILPFPKPWVPDDHPGRRPLR